MTEKLYFSDSYNLSFEAQIVEQGEYNTKPYVILDSTSFYPTGGGQPHDTGTIDGVRVTDVFVHPERDKIFHILDTALKAGSVTAEIDWDRRFFHMVHHTAQHILSRVFLDILDAKTTAFHLTDPSISIEIDCKDIPLEVLTAIENRANQIVFENREVRSWFLTADQRSQVELSVPISDKIVGDPRIVEIVDFDSCACGGTHVSYTGEIGLIKVIQATQTKKRSKIEFCCGQRALEDYRHKNRLIVNLAQTLNVTIEDIHTTFERNQNQLKETKSKLKEVQSKLLIHEAKQLRKDTTSQATNGDFTVISKVWEIRESWELQNLADILIQQPGTIVLLGTAGEKSHVIIASSEDLAYDVRPLLKEVFAELGKGSGGGRPNFAQGGGFEVTFDELSSVISTACRRIAVN